MATAVCEPSTFSSLPPVCCKPYQHGQSGLLRRMCTPSLHRYSCHKLEDKQILRVVSWFVFRVFSMALHTHKGHSYTPSSAQFQS